MTVHVICDELLRAWSRRPGCPDALASYVAAHRRLLEVYNADFGPGGDVAEAFRRRWTGRPSAVRALLARLAAADPASLAAAGLEAATRLLRPRRPPEVVLLLGLGWSNACQLLVDGRPVVAVSLEAWGGEFFRTRLPWEDLPLWVAHECAHLVRYAEGACSLARFFSGQGFDYAEALAALPLREFLVDEGLATAAAAACFPERAPARALGFGARTLAWCRRHEAALWAEVAPLLEAPPGEEGYARYLSAGGSPLSKASR